MTADFTTEQRKIIYDAVFEYNSVFELTESTSEKCIEICEKITDEGLI